MRDTTPKELKIGLRLIMGRATSRMLDGRPEEQLAECSEIANDVYRAMKGIERLQQMGILRDDK